VLESFVADNFPISGIILAQQWVRSEKDQLLPRGKTMYLPTSLQRMLFWLFDKLHIA